MKALSIPLCISMLALQFATPPALAQSVSATSPTAPTPAAIREAVRAVFDEGSYQTELPIQEVETSWEPPGGGSGWLVTVFVILLVALVVVILVAWLSSHFRDRPGKPAPASTVAPVASLRISDAALADSEGLARLGRFDEAIHVLLLRTIEEFRTRVDFRPHPSLTSREIRDRAPLPTEARAAFDRLVVRVETSWFGGRPVTEADYRSCVEHFEALRAHCGPGAA